MNKTELIDQIAAGAGLTKVDAKKALDATVAAIKNALVKGDKIQLVGFGTFAVAEKPAREGINPATKQKIKIAAKKVAKKHGRTREMEMARAWDGMERCWPLPCHADSHRQAAPPRYPCHHRQ